MPYSDNQTEDMVREGPFMAAFDAWTERFAAFVAKKGEVEPRELRAFGYAAPGHRWADAKLKWRELRMKMGLASAGSSPAAQQELGINRDATLSPRQGEGDKLREQTRRRSRRLTTRQASPMRGAWGRHTQPMNGFTGGPMCSSR